MRTRFHSTALLTTCVLAAATPAIAAESGAATSAATVLRKFDIPAQAAGTALNTFAKQADITLVFSADAVRGTQTNSLVGEYSIAQALEQLLQGTQLSYQRLSDNSVAVSNQADGNTSALGESLQEIVVTAQRHTERLLDVPMSITVLQGERLDKSSFDGVREALNTVPGVSIFANQNDNPQLSVRGVSAAVTRFAGSGIAGYYMDTVPFALISSAIVPDSNAYDLERVEVLRGPQGTLYGASSLNGVMRVLTKDADLNEVQFKGRVLASNTDGGGTNYWGDAALNVPLIEGKLAARVVGGYQDQSGWIDRPHRADANSSERNNVRAKINAQPTDALSIGLTAWRSRISRDATSVDAQRGRSPVPIDEPNSDDYDVFGLKIGYEFAAFTLTSMTSHIEATSTSNLAIADFSTDPIFVTPAYTDLEAKVFAQEVLLTSNPGGSWRWAIGGLYRDAEDKLFQNYPEFDILISDRQETSESHALFGEITRIVLDGKIELTGGLRYFEDDVTVDDRPTGMTPRATFSNTSPRAVVTWLSSESLRIYASYAEGFRSGVHQQSSVIPTGIPPADPDTLTSYELGTKGTLWNGRIAFDTSLYYIDWDKLQQPLFVLIDIGGIPASTLAAVNGDSASGLGYDLSLTLRPVSALTLGATFSWNDLTFDSDVISGPFVYARRGDRLNFSPETTYGAFANYSIPFGGSGYTGTVAVSANHTSEMLGRVNNGLTAGSDPITMTRASFTVAAPRNWSATLFVDNALNEDGSLSPTLGPSTSDGLLYWNARLRPRTVGLQFDYSFN